MDKTSVARLLRCSWKAVDHVVDRVVVEHIDAARLDGLPRIGVDEVSYKARRPVLDDPGRSRLRPGGVGRQGPHQSITDPGHVTAPDITVRRR
jgi:hypothetical protein